MLIIHICTWFLFNNFYSFFKRFQQIPKDMRLQSMEWYHFNAASVNLSDMDI